MMRDSWALKGSPQYILARRLLQKQLTMNIRKEKPKGDEYIVDPYLRQNVENL